MSLGCCPGTLLMFTTFSVKGIAHEIRIVQHLSMVDVAVSKLIF
jgi:hypothetical protein